MDLQESDFQKTMIHNSTDPEKLQKIQMCKQMIENADFEYPMGTRELINEAKKKYFKTQ